MKKHIHLILFVLSFLGFSPVWAGAMTCEDSSLPVKLSELMFVGDTFTNVRNAAGVIDRGCTVIMGMRTEKQALPAGQSCNLVRINPGNPNYLTGEKRDSIPSGKQGGTPTTNNLGYYFCTNASKKAMCIHQKAVNKNPNLEINYTNNTNNEGECMCKVKGQAAQKCTAEPEVIAEANFCKGELADKKEDGKCYCKSDGSVLAEGGHCPEPETIVDTELAPCIEKLEVAKQNCAVKSKDTVNKCSKDAPSFNKHVSEAQKLLNLGIDALVAKKAGTGALDTCIRMGGAGTVLSTSLGFLRETCKGELKECKSACDEAETLAKQPDEEYIKQCKEHFSAEGKTFKPSHEAKLTEMLKQHKELGEATRKICTVEAVAERSKVDDFFNELDENIRQANICQCQLTSASEKTADCLALLGPAACSVNPNQPACAFSTVSCGPGSANPACTINFAAIPMGGSTGINGAPSGFGNVGGSSISNGGGVVAAGKGGIDVGDVDLGETSKGVSGAVAAADLGSPFGVAGGGGGGGGGGFGGGDSGSAGGGSGEGKEKSGLGGLFNNVRSGIANLFGGSSSEKKAMGKKADPKSSKSDINAFRPRGVRGLANSSGELGGKNRDIWKTMSERYNDQYHTFITVENPQK